MRWWRHHPHRASTPSPTMDWRKRSAALKARATVAKRMGREKQVMDMPEPATGEQDRWNDLQPLLDQELSRLPDRYRRCLGVAPEPDPDMSVLHIGKAWALDYLKDDLNIVD